jgi:hypothetical protein
MAHVASHTIPCRVEPFHRQMQPKYGGAHCLAAMTRLCFLAVFLLLPATAQSATQNIPPPGTIDDGKPLKAAADGPPRTLIHMDAPELPRRVATAENPGRRQP